MAEQIDYQKLLMWYIQHVGEMEGVTFLTDRYKPDDGSLTDREWGELQWISGDGPPIEQD